MPLGPGHRTPDHAPPARKAVRAATTVTSPDDTSAGVPAVTLEPVRLRITEYSAPLAPVVGPMLPGRPQPNLPVSLPLSLFAVPTPDLAPAPAQPQPLRFDGVRFDGL